MAPYYILLFGRAGGGLLQQISCHKIRTIQLVAIFTLLSLSLSIYINSVVKILYISMSNKKINYEASRRPCEEPAAPWGAGAHSLETSSLEF